MSIASDKRKMFSNLAATTSIGKHGNIPEQTNTMLSVNNSNDPTSLLLDVLGVVAGTAGLQILIGELFVNFTNSAEPKMKTALKKQFTQHNSNQKLPTYFVNDGIAVPVSDIDVKKQILTPNSLLYDNSKPNFNNSLTTNINNNGSTEVTYGNTPMKMKYNSLTDKVVVKPTTSDMTIGNFFGDFVDNTELINKKEFMSNVMNSIYGTIDSESDKSVEQLYQEQQISMLLNNLSNDDDSLELTQAELDECFKKANDLKNGVIKYDLGCGMYDVSLSMNDLTNLISDISGSTNPDFVGNKIANIVIGSNTDTTAADENKETMKDGFFKKILDIVKKTLFECLVSSPQIRVLMAIFGAFNNNGTIQISNPLEDFKKFKSLIKCLVDEMKKILSEFIFNLILTFLLALLAPVIKTIVKEKINNYLTVLKSLI